MNNELGIMQGRLTPKYQGHYQSHPAFHWQSEFFIAKELGFSCIEFILDSWFLEDNPIRSEDGRKLIKHLVNLSGVKVKSLCADVFMDITFVSNERNHDSKKAIKLMKETIEAAAVLGIRDIVVPCVDRSSIPDEAGRAQFVKLLSPLCSEAFDKGIRINIEADWGPKEFIEVLDEIGEEKVWVNYDTGNSASLGHDPKIELSTYGNRISDFHIKDRLLDGGSVPLGAGDTDFDSILSWIKNSGFKSPLIFQVARGDSFVQDLTLLEQQLNWFKQRWSEC